MQSTHSNFDFLAEHDPVFFQLASTAEQVYKYIVDLWIVFDTSGFNPIIIKSSENYGK